MYTLDGRVEEGEENKGHRVNHVLNPYFKDFKRNFTVCNWVKLEIPLGPGTINSY